MNWKVVIIGSGKEHVVREIAASFAKYLKEDGARVNSAEFQGEKPEESLDLLHVDVGDVLEAFRERRESEAPTSADVDSSNVPAKPPEVIITPDPSVAAGANPEDLASGRALKTKAEPEPTEANTAPAVTPEVTP